MLAMGLMRTEDQIRLWLLRRGQCSHRCHSGVKFCHRPSHLCAEPGEINLARRDCNRALIRGDQPLCLDNPTAHEGLKCIIAGKPVTTTRTLFQELKLDLTKLKNNEVRLNLSILSLNALLAWRLTCGVLFFASSMLCWRRQHAVLMRNARFFRHIADPKAPPCHAFH
jgi:hypothetical protein